MATTEKYFRSVGDLFLEKVTYSKGKAVKRVEVLTGIDNYSNVGVNVFDREPYRIQPTIGYNKTTKEVFEKHLNEVLTKIH